jgi:hypothetical protein
MIVNVKDRLGKNVFEGGFQSSGEADRGREAVLR